MQSAALLRWAGRRAGLYPEPLQLRIDSVEEALADVRKALTPQWYANALGRHPMTGEFCAETVLSAEQQRALARQLNSAVLPARFEQLERVLVASGGPHMCGRPLTTCDLSLYVMASGLLDGSYCDGVSPAVLERCPGLLALTERVGSHPRVVDWYARRPGQGIVSESSSSD